MNSIAAVLQVHLGNSIPDYIVYQIKQTRYWNPDVSLYFITNVRDKDSDRLLKELDVVIVRYDSLNISSSHKYFLRKNRFDKRYRGGFWVHTSERFFAMESFLRTCELENIFHLENDMMLYVSLNDILPIFRDKYQGLGITMDSDNRCIPGFMFIRDLDSICNLTSFMAKKTLKNQMNDMYALADYLISKGEPYCKNLPVISPSYEKKYLLRDTAGNNANKNYYSTCFDDFHGIFDAAALGQYLGGVDPRNTTGDTRGFVNETAVYDPKKFGLHWETVDGLKRMVGEVAGDKFPIFSLHIHSKDTKQFMSK
jgi:hypothetical protein